jgi:hypothetical protein
MEWVYSMGFSLPMGWLEAEAFADSTAQLNAISVSR